MADPSPADNRLGAYLRARRALVTPEQTGLTAGSARRVPGLRREEVSLLAGISNDYYLRIERGRDRHPSPQVLRALARVLLLDDVETAHLLHLAADRPATRRRPVPERVPARLESLLRSVGVPAFVEGRFLDVLAANPLAAALSPRLRPGQNRLRSLLLDVEEQDFQVDWEASVRECIAVFRHGIGDDLDHPRATELVGELSLASARFRTLWAQQDVAVATGGLLRVRHPVVGALTAYRDKLPVEGTTLVLYHPTDDEASRDGFALLAHVAGAGNAAT